MFLEVGKFKVLEPEGIYRITPAVTDGHCELPDRWSSGKKWDSRWSSRRCQRSLPLQPVKPTRSGSPCLNKGCRTVTLAILYSPAGWRSSETWNWVPALPMVRDTSCGRCTVHIPYVFYFLRTELHLLMLKNLKQLIRRCVNKMKMAKSQNNIIVKVCK